MTDAAADLDTAARRLTAAMDSLERRMGAGPAGGGETFASDAFDADRQRLGSELDAAQARVRALEAAAREAAEAVDLAASEIRAAMSAPAEG